MAEDVKQANGKVLENWVGISIMLAGMDRPHDVRCELPDVAGYSGKMALSCAGRPRLEALVQRACELVARDMGGGAGKQCVCGNGHECGCATASRKGGSFDPEALVPPVIPIPFPEAKYAPENQEDDGDVDVDGGGGLGWVLGAK